MNWHPACNELVLILIWGCMHSSSRRQTHSVSHQASPLCHDRPEAFHLRRQAGPEPHSTSCLGQNGLEQDGIPRLQS
jgi:hypothetical protein